MKKLYYFCKSQKRFIEIKNFKGKVLTYYLLLVLTSSALVLSGYYFISSFSDSYSNISELKKENETLKAKLFSSTELFKALDNDLKKIIKENNDLRLAANLPLISEEERMLGVGGGYFDNNIDFTSEEEINGVLNYIEEVSRKISFEKRNFAEISHKLETNKSLYSCMPALKPASGTVGLSGFGMREHPILNIEKMHEGIDIITDVGTPVIAPGDGIVEFVNHSGGYGLAIEINHGFGYKTIYAHLSETFVKEGEKIKRGTLIAKTGNSGLSTGPHLHYEVHHNGVKLDPKNFFFDDLNLFENKQ